MTAGATDRTRSTQAGAFQALISRARRLVATLLMAMFATLLAACGDVGLHGPLPPDAATGDDASLFVPMFFGDGDGALGQFKLNGKSSTDAPQVFTVTTAGRDIIVVGKQPDQTLAAMLFRVVARISPRDYLVHYAEGPSGSAGTGCVVDTDPQLVKTCATVDSAGKVTVTSTPAKANYARLELLADGGIRISTLVDAPQDALSAVLTDSGVSLRVGDDKRITQDLLTVEPAGRIYTALRNAAERDETAATSSTVILDFHPTGPDAALEAAANLAAWAGQYDRAATIARTFAVTDDPAHAATLGQLSRRGLLSQRDCALEQTAYRQAKPLADGVRAIMQNAKGGPAMFGSFASLPDDLAGPAASCETQSLSISTSAAPVAAAGMPTRRALVIGMSGYTDPRLLVPGDRTKADALAVADVLKNVAQYADPVIMPPDADNAVFDATFTAFLATVKQGDQVLLFYSGHGIEYRGDNYLLLRDAQGVMPQDDFSIKRLLDRTATSLRDMIKALKARGPSNVIVVLNACRNITDPNLSGGDGSFDFNPPARMQSEPGVGTIFATTSDTFAEVCLGDCAKDQSPYTVFTRRFIEKLRTPNLSVRRLVDEVTAEVAEDVRTHNGKQQLVDYHDQTADPLNRDKLFIGPVLSAGIDVIVKPDPAPQKQPDPSPAPDAAIAARALEECRLAAAPPLLFERIEPAPAVAACTSAVALNPASADAEGWLGRAYDAQTDYGNAALHYRVAADRGMALAQHNLANLYRKGQGVAVDAAEAFRLYQLAADREFPQSFASLAEFYERGEVVGKDLAEARRLFQLAANRGVARGIEGVERVDALLASSESARQCEALAAPPRNGKGVELTSIDTVKAEAACRTALADHPGDADMAFYLGRVLNAAGRGAESVKVLTQAADAGHAAAQNALGRMYVTGTGTTKDEAKAFALFDKSAAQGNPEGLVNLADSYVNGIGVAQDLERGAELYRKAIAQGSDSAPFWLANLYLFGSGVPKDYAEAKRLYEQARRNGVIGATIGLGMIYENGYGVPVDLAAALAQYGEGSAAGNAGASFRLGQMYEKGLGVVADLANARRLYRLAADKGNAEAKRALERLGPEVDVGAEALAICRGMAAPRIAGKGIEFNAMDAVTADTSCQSALAALPGNPEVQFLAGRAAERAGRTADALALYQKASDQGYAPAQSSLGLFYINGTAVTRNTEKGLELTNLAANAGYAPALTNLGYLYLQGNGVTKDFDAAFRNFSAAARSGSSLANVELANLYMLGRGTKVDFTAALSNYRTAWADGQTPGAVGIGLIYENGYGLIANYAEAMRFYEAASKAGNAEGTYYVGRLYELGKGVTKDIATAKRLYQEAADAGDKNAKSALTRLGATSDAGDGALATCRELAAPRIAGRGREVWDIDTDKAGAACRAAVAAAPESGEMAFYLSRVLSMTGETEEAASLLKRAVEARDPGAIFETAKDSCQLTNTAVSAAACLDLLERGAKSGYLPATAMLGRVLMIEDRSVTDLPRAVDLLETAVSLGDDDSAYWLATLYVRGKGVAVNYVRAGELFEAALKHGEIYAALFLGNMYEDGQLGPVNVDKAMEYYAMAAEKGVMYGYYNMGMIYEYGTGGTVDLGRAESYYRKALDGGLAEARAALDRVAKAKTS